MTRRGSCGAGRAGSCSCPGRGTRTGAPLRPDSGTDSGRGSRKNRGAAEPRGGTPQGALSRVCLHDPSVLSTSLSASPLLTSLFPQNPAQFPLRRVVGLSFHPGGTHLASSSGDSTAKVWEFEKRKCVLTLSDHTQAVWSVAYHHTGDFLVRWRPAASQVEVPRGALCTAALSLCGARSLPHSYYSSCLLRSPSCRTQQYCCPLLGSAAEVLNACSPSHSRSVPSQASGSLDHSARLWDLTTGRCKSVLRGHVDSVNEVCWQPFSNTLATASSDKTVSLWDVRTGLCAQTFYGHMNRRAQGHPRNLSIWGAGSVR